MSGHGPDASPLLVTEHAASLRHDLANPISLIVGYAELLAMEAGDRGSIAICAPLGSVRRIALDLLARIDRVLLNESTSRDPRALRRLADELLGPALLIVHEVETLIRSVHSVESTGSVVEDLDKIRMAGAQLVVQIEAIDSSSIADA